MADAKGKKIIIVDDDKFLIDMYSLKFHNEGIVVDHAFSGEELLVKLKAGETADLLLLDIVMPSMDGIEILKKIREENLIPSAKIVMLTNQNEEQDMEKAKALKIDGYIVKASATPSEVVQQAIKIITS